VYRLNISDEFEVRLRKVLSNTLSSPAAADAKAIIEAETKSRADLLKRVKAASAEMKAMEGKPITIIGKTPDGKDFTSADWKGKVVMADFWATWCGPCLVGLPEVKAQYKKYHDRGFEIIGVSDDSDAKTLTAFIARNEMPWPQLFDPHFNPTKGALLVQQYHVMGIPTLFLIDKKGNLRTVDARKSMEELIPKLLAESAE
jgi:peroxiredoxin